MSKHEKRVRYTQQYPDWREFAAQEAQQEEVVPEPDQSSELPTEVSEYLSHMALEELLERSHYEERQAHMAQNENRGIRSETLYIHGSVHQPDVIFLAETTMPARSQSIADLFPNLTDDELKSALQSAMQRRMAVIYSEQSGPFGTITIEDIHSLAPEVQTSGHQTITMRTLANVLPGTHDTLPRPHDVTGPVTPRRHVKL